MNKNEVSLHFIKIKFEIMFGDEYKKYNLFS